MYKIVIAVFSVLLLTGYSGSIAPVEDDIAEISFRPLADSVKGKWVSFTEEQATLVDDNVEVAER